MHRPYADFRFRHAEIRSSEPAKRVVRRLRSLRALNTRQAAPGTGIQARPGASHAHSEKVLRGQPHCVHKRCKSQRKAQFFPTICNKNNVVRRMLNQDYPDGTCIAECRMRGLDPRRRGTPRGRAETLHRRTEVAPDGGFFRGRPATPEHAPAVDSHMYQPATAPRSNVLRGANESSCHPMATSAVCFALCV